MIDNERVVLIAWCQEWWGPLWSTVKSDASEPDRKVSYKHHSECGPAIDQNPIAVFEWSQSLFFLPLVSHRTRQTFQNEFSWLSPFFEEFTFQGQQNTSYFGLEVSKRFPLALRPSINSQPALLESIVEIKKAVSSQDLLQTCKTMAVHYSFGPAYFDATGIQRVGSLLWV